MAGLASTAVSVVAVVATGLLGPSVAQPPLGPRSWLPPWHLALEPSPWLVTGLLLVAVAAGALGLGLAMVALRRGWRPPVGRLVAGSVVAVAALVAVPPMGSADHLSYAAYGRIAVLGGDPYRQPPSSFPEDPVVSAAEPPWRSTPSVYGPLTTAEQRAAAALAGPDVRRTVLLLSLANAAAFLLTGSLLLRLAGADLGARARAVLLFWLNPLVLWAVVAGAHVDALLVLPVVAALTVLRGRPGAGRVLVSGALLGAGVAVKATGALALLALAWVGRRRVRDVAILVAGAGLVALPAYALAGPHVLDQLLRARRLVSLATPWHLVDAWLRGPLGHPATRSVIGAGAAAAFAVVAVVLWRRRGDAGPPRSRASGTEADLTPRLAETWRVHDAATALAVVVAAYLLTAPYALPWYDVLLWAPLALLPLGRLHVLALAHTTVLAVAYLPGRVEVQPEALARLALAVRTDVAPWLLLAVLIAALVRRRGAASRRPWR